MDAAEVARAIGRECLCFRARRTARAVTRVYDEALRPLGLAANQFSLLCVVAAGGAAGQRMPRLSAMLSMDASTLSRNLRPLQADGLVVVDRLEADRRVRVARLTEAGRARLEAAVVLWRKAQSEVIAQLGDEASLALRLGLDAALAAVT